MSASEGGPIQPSSVDEATATTAPAALTGIPGAALVVLVGAAVSVALGVYGQVHDPSGESLYTLFFTNTINLKVWFATVAVCLALFQGISALRIFGKINVPRTMPSWYGDAHRLSGTWAFLFSLPVAYHCLWSLGFQSGETRLLVHSLLGCTFYGVFVAKVAGVRGHALPGWFLPVMGGIIFTVLVGLWATSSLWFFTNVGFPEI